MLRMLYNTFINLVDRAKDYILQIKELPLDEDVPLAFPPSNPYLLPNIPESARVFFASVSSPTEILASNLVSRVQGDATMYTYLTSTQTNLRGHFPLSCAFQLMQMPIRKN